MHRRFAGGRVELWLSTSPCYHTTNGSIIPCTEIIDGVSWEGGGTGDVTAMSATVCADPASHPGYANGGSSNLGTLQRCPNGSDTDNSSNDFTVADDGNLYMVAAQSREGSKVVEGLIYRLSGL